MRPTLIHIHIPKTAGTTINTMLGEALAGKEHYRFPPPGDIKPLTEMSEDNRNRIDFLFGHFPHGLHTFFKRPTFYIASLREPRQRLFSFYRYLLATAEHPLHQTVRNAAPDFSSFIMLATENAAVRDEVDNIQVRMIAGRMTIQPAYDSTLELALTNIGQDNFFVGRMEQLSSFMDRLGRELTLEFGQVPRLNASDSGSNFDSAMANLTPVAREQLAHFVMWDTILCTIVQDSEGLRSVRQTYKRSATASGAVEGPSTGGNTMSETAEPTQEPAIDRDTDAIIRELVSAMYKVLLMREADVVGFNTYAQEIRSGTPIEAAILRMIRSAEFREKLPQFIDAHIQSRAATT